MDREIESDKYCRTMDREIESNKQGDGYRKESNKQGDGQRDRV